MSRRPVELVRVPREEELYDREEVLGRDTSSVFPTESKKKALDAESAKELVGGALKFVSEKELEEIKSSRGLSVEDGTIASNKTLAEVLAENKKKKGDAFQEQWQRMKQGKNRPLDEDEAEFFDILLRQRAEQERQAREYEDNEMEVFREALKQRAPESIEAEDPTAGPHSSILVKHTATVKGPQPEPPKPKAPPAAKPLIRIKPKAASAHHRDDSSTTKRQKLEDDAVRETRKPRETETATGDDQGDGGLMGLLGAYGSDEDNQEDEK